MGVKVNVNIRMDKEIKEKFQKKASSMGTSLSNIVNMYAYKFVNTGEIEFYLDEDKKCSDELKLELEEIDGSDEFFDSKAYKKGKKILSNI